MNTELGFKLEVETRKVRDMCTVLSKDELTDLIVELYRSDILKNDFIKTMMLGDLNGSNVSRFHNTDLTETEVLAMASWIIGSQ